MKTKLLSLWESIHTSFWFLPALIALGSIGLSYGLIQLDKALSWDVERPGAIYYPGGPEGARLLLSTIAGSMITVAGVTFSITIVALTLASSQFGPRLLRNFMADKGTQLVLGTFIGTFVYCMLVLRSIQEDNADVFVPRISITVGIVLALASFGILIFFFHHASTSIQADRVIEAAYHDLIESMDAFFSDAGPKPSNPQLEDHTEIESRGATTTVFSRKSGYIRAIDLEGLMASATEHDLTIRLVSRAGNFAYERTPLAVVAGGQIDTTVERHIRRAWILGASRTLEQDVEFPIQQMVDMALRALSPSLNDPYTAMSCIDRLGGAVCHVNAKQFPPARRYDDEGRLRLILHEYTYEGILDAAFNQIRQNARQSVAVHIRLLESLKAAAMTARTDEQRQVIHRHVERVHRASQQALTEHDDREDFDRRFHAVMQSLGLH